MEEKLNFKVSGKELSTALKKCVGVTGGEGISANVALVVRSNKLTLLALNNIMQVSVDVGIINNGGKWIDKTVNADKLHKIAQSNVSEFMELHDDNGRVIVNSDSSTFSLETLPFSDFPELRDDVDSNTISINSDLLLKMISNVSFIIMKNGEKNFYSCVMLNAKDNSVRCSATDGHRLSVTGFNLATGDSNDNIECLIPYDSVGELSKMLSSCDGDVDMRLSENNASFSTPNTKIITRMINEKFADIELFINKQFNSIYKCKRALLLQAINKVSIVALGDKDQRSQRLVINMRLDEFDISMANSSNEKANDNIGVEFISDGISSMTIGFNFKYLKQALLAIDDDEIVMNCDSPKTFVSVHGYTNKSVKHIIMPIQI